LLFIFTEEFSQLSAPVGGPEQVHQMKLKTKAMLIFEAKRIIVVEIEN
jgi:hypothetical protein